jgi:hypothetical protein
MKQTDVIEVRTASFITVIKAFIILMMEAVRASETSVYFYSTTRRYIPESSYILTLAAARTCQFHVPVAFIRGKVLRCLLDS